METLLRVQDSEGRGPFKPGFSGRWRDRTLFPGMKELPTFMEEFGLKSILRLLRPGEHMGCAVRDLRGIHRWFSPTERMRLRELGYSVVKIEVDRILAESENQITFARSRPLNVDVETVAWE